MGLFRRRPPRQEYAVSAEVLWGALKAGLPTVTSQATFYEESHRVEWTMDLSAFDWPERMSARVEASRDGCAVVTVEGKSAYGTGAKSIVGPGRRKKAAAALLAAVSAVISQSGGATARPPADDDGYRYWDGRQWTLQPPPPHHPVRRAGLRSTARHADLEMDAVYLAAGANDPADLIADSSHLGAQPLIVPSLRYAPNDKAEITR